MDPLSLLAQRSHISRNNVTEDRRDRKKSVQLSQGVAFSTMLENAEYNTLDGTAGVGLGSDIIDDAHFEESLDRVFILGENLKKDHSLSCLAEYKKAVRYFLDIILKRAYQHTDIKGALNPKTMLQSSYSIVRVVDEKLENLLRAVLSEQADTLAILEKVDELKGILINYLR